MLETKKYCVNIQNYYLCSSIYIIKPKHLTSVDFIIWCHISFVSSTNVHVSIFFSLFFKYNLVSFDYFFQTYYPTPFIVLCEPYVFRFQMFSFFVLILLLFQQVQLFSLAFLKSLRAVTMSNHHPHLQPSLHPYIAKTATMRIFLNKKNRC